MAHATHRTCDSSCPDCLRSWDNRQLHGLLDWRLALDMAELAAGKPLTTSRWFMLAGPLAERFADAYKEALDDDVHVESAGGLVTLRSGRRAVVLGHPLWRIDAAPTSQQGSACLELRERGVKPVLSDVRRLRNRPESIYAELAPWPLARKAPPGEPPFSGTRTPP